jgi:hypothetical protein
MRDPGERQHYNRLSELWKSPPEQTTLCSIRLKREDGSDNGPHLLRAGRTLRCAALLRNEGVPTRLGGPRAPG